MDYQLEIDDLRTALDRGELVFFYQPKISMVLGIVSGAEALIRWCRPDGSIVPPAAFIPLAESTGFIRELTLRMLEPLVVDLTILQTADPGLTVSFNASGKDFEGPELVEAVCRRVDQGLVAPGALEVEVTESAVLAAGPELNARLETLRQRGVSLAMDDFGTGYSSIDSLSRLPFSSIKIDQGIVRRMDVNHKDAAIVESSIRLGHRLGLDVVAEGIESKASFVRLQSSGCTTGQGYWMGKPMPLESFIEVVRGGQRWPAGALGLVHMAALDHLEWRKALLEGFLSDGAAADPGDLDRFELDPRECRLGRWYQGPGRVLAALPAYAALAEPHRALHECATRITLAAADGRPMSEVLPLMREMTEHSTHIIAALQELEHAVLTRMAQLEAERVRRSLSPSSAAPALA